MSPEGLAFIVFVGGMLLLMGIGMNMALALVLTGAGMAWVLDFWDTQLLAQNLVAGIDGGMIGAMMPPEAIRPAEVFIG